MQESPRTADRARPRLQHRTLARRSTLRVCRTQRRRPEAAVTGSAGVRPGRDRDAIASRKLIRMLRRDGWVHAGTRTAATGIRARTVGPQHCGIHLRPGQLARRPKELKHHALTSPFSNPPRTAATASASRTSPDASPPATPSTTRSSASSASIPHLSRSRSSTPSSARSGPRSSTGPSQHRASPSLRVSRTVPLGSGKDGNRAAVRKLGALPDAANGWEVDPMFDYLNTGHHVCVFHGLRVDFPVRVTEDMTIVPAAVDAPTVERAVG